VANCRIESLSLIIVALEIRFLFDGALSSIDAAPVVSL
jgi:hypothetical protein